MSFARCYNCNSGEMSEWLKEHAWKVCIRERIEGSNPSLSTKIGVYLTKKFTNKCLKNINIPFYNI